MVGERQIQIYEVTIRLPKNINPERMLIYFEGNNLKTSCTFNLRIHKDCIRASKLVTYAGAYDYQNMEGHKVHLVKVGKSLWAIGNEKIDRFFLLKGTNTSDLTMEELIKMDMRLNTIG